MTETKLDDFDDIQCKDFIFKYKNRKNFVNKSGGIAVGYKTYLKDHVKIIETECHFVLWLSVEKEVFHSEKKIIFGIVYVPPENTLYTSENAFSDIESEFQSFYNNTNLICLVGDFNARTGSLPDYIEANSTNDYFDNNVVNIADFTELNILDELCINKVRNSVDNVVNKYGRKLLEFCKFNNVFIFNGRVGQDIVGKQTSKNSSVVDYILGTAHLFESVENFVILDFNRLYSDIHCPLTLVINAKRNDMCMNRVYEQNVNKIRPWKVEKIYNFRNSIDGCILQRIREKLSLCTNDMENIDKIKMDEIVDDVCDLFLGSARDNFGIVGKNCQYKKNDDKLWFNTECHKA